MLNLFAYGTDEDEENPDSEEQTKNPDSKEDKDTTVEEATSATQSKSKKSKQRKVLNVEKITGVSKDELLHEAEEDEDEIVPKNKKHPITTSNSFPSKESKSYSPSEKGNNNGDDDEVISDGVNIPLNPFLSNTNADASEESDKDDTTVSYNIPYKVVYRSPASQTVQPTVQPSVQPTVQQTSVADAPPSTGYGASYSQSQYEAFMRRSGMLDSANAQSTSSLEFMGENIKCYDKNMIRAFKEGSFIELDQNSIHNHMEQPGNEYWERKDKRAKIAEQFGKYAHIAPTQLQQTRNQISYLATKAIDDLMDLDKRRATARKTRKEIRAKYGW